MTADPMADAPRNEPIEALFDGEWLEVEWSDSAWDGSPYGTEGWASDGMLILDLEAWRYPGDPEPHGCPTHGDDCPGHLHYEARAEADLAVSWVGPHDESNVRTTVLHHLPADGKDFRAYQEPMVRFISNESMRANGPAGWLSDKIDAATKAALNDAMVEAGGIRPQRALVGLDPEAAAPRQQLHFGFDLAADHGLVSWADWEPVSLTRERTVEFCGVTFVGRAPVSLGEVLHEQRGYLPWHDTTQAARDVAAKHAPDYGEMAIQRHRDGNAYYTRGPGSAVWSPSRPVPVPELTPPPPATGCASRHAFLYEGESWQVMAWPGYPQDELIERLNLRWRYGNPPATPDRARRAGVRP